MLFGYFVNSFFGNSLRCFNEASPKGVGGKKYEKLQVCSRGRAEGAADIGRPVQRPVFDRTAVQDGLYDYHQAQV